MRQGDRQLGHRNLLLWPHMVCFQKRSSRYCSIQAFLSGSQPASAGVSMNTQDWHLSSPHGTDYTQSKLKRLGFFSLTSNFGMSLNSHTVYWGNDLHVVIMKRRPSEAVLQFLARARKSSTSQAQHHVGRARKGIIRPLTVAARPIGAGVGTTYNKRVTSLPQSQDHWFAQSVPHLG